MIHYQVILMICVMFICFFIVNEMNFQQDNIFKETLDDYHKEIDFMEKHIIEIHNEINELKKIKKNKLESLYKEQSNAF